MDPLRLRRAVFLDVKATGGDAWLVSGGAALHRVTEDGGRLECDCADRAIREVGCKHILRVLLSQGHPAVIRGLREVVPADGGAAAGTGPFRFSKREAPAGQGAQDVDTEALRARIADRIEGIASRLQEEEDDG